MRFGDSPYAFESFAISYIYIVKIRPLPCATSLRLNERIDRSEISSYLESVSTGQSHRWRSVKYHLDLKSAAKSRNDPSGQFEASHSFLL